MDIHMVKILMVEDNDAMAVMLEMTLVAGGYEVIRATDGNKALRLYDPQTIDLVLTDLVMPNKEGMELICELKRANPAVKIIAMSGGGFGNAHTYLATAERLGAVHTLAKPFSGDELFAALTSILEKTS
jgi:DNA-binding response OmpR family regulator